MLLLDMPVSIILIELLDHAVLLLSYKVIIVMLTIIALMAGSEQLLE